MGPCPECVCKPARRVPPRAQHWLLRNRHMRRWFVRCAALGPLLCCCVQKAAHAQYYTAIQRQQAEIMLRDVTDDVKKHYYDPARLGSGWDAAVREAKEQIEKSDSINRALSSIAAVLDSLHDSHTFFLPPSRPFRNDYGFEMQMVGDRCYVTRVRPGSDAAAKGLRPGDEIVSVDGYAPARSDIWRMKNVFWVLQPQPALRLVLRDASGNQRQVDVAAQFRQIAPAITDLSGSGKADMLRAIETEEDAIRPRFAQRGANLLIVKLRTFSLSPGQIDSVLRKMRSHIAVVLDLRGNPGGDREAVKSLLGGLFEKKVKIGQALGRRQDPAIETETCRHAFTGPLLVLLDSESGSGSEVFARVIQLEKRGLVLGDRSAGRVMAAQRFMHQAGLDTVIVYGASVTDSAIEMADGQSLEHKGVMPDKLILPTAADLAGGRDPVLAVAAQMLNVEMTPEEAGALFPFQWPQE